MHIPPSAHALAVALPGRWRVCATNMPVWLDSRRRDVVIDFSLASKTAFVLRETVTFTVDGSGSSSSGGGEKKTRGRSKWVRDGFVWRGSGRLLPVSGRWSVIGLSVDSTVAVQRFRKTALVPAGLTVLVRESSGPRELRTEIARSASEFGLGAEDFATLSWLSRPQSSY